MINSFSTNVPGANVTTHHLGVFVSNISFGVLSAVNVGVKVSLSIADI